MRRSGVAIGIDLGTTKCCVGVVRDGRVEIVENERGSKTTLSYVAFTETERLVGDDAKDQVTVNPANTVFGVKGLMGRNYEQAVAHCSENNLPFSLENESGRPRIKVNYLGREESLAPEQISAVLLSKMKKLAESHLGCPVTDAVISVPAYFNNSQRLATKAAAEIAGLRVLRLINEPTAAAIAFKVSRSSSKKETIITLDIGGGTFDAAVTTINPSSVDVVAVHGNCHFGGQCFDNFLIKYFVDEFSQKHGMDLRKHKKSMERLREACSKIKHTLTLLPKARHTIECILDDIDFDVEMTRKIFEEWSSKFIKGKLRSVLNLLPQKLVCNADYVVAVGGSTRVPKIQAFFNDYFEKKLTKTINIDEAVAYGAAFQAALLSGDCAVEEVQVSDYVPHIIDVIPTWEPVGTIIPNSSSSGPPFSMDVPVNVGTTICEFVYYPDYRMTEYNQVGIISFPDSHHSRESRPVPIQYEIDADGIFQAVTLSQSTESNHRSHLANVHLDVIDVDEIQRMRQAEMKFEEENKKHQEQTQALSELEHMCFQLKQNIVQHRGSTRADPEKVMRMCDYVLDRLDENPDLPLPALRKFKAELMNFTS